MLTALFRGSEHEQAEDSTKPVEGDSDEITPFLEEEVDATVQADFSEILDNFDKSLAEYKKAKQGMQRLGFTDYDEYLDYLEFTQRKAVRKSDMEV